MIKLIQVFNAVVFMIVAWSVMLAISIVIVGTTILGLSLTILPSAFVLDLSVSPFVRLFALSIYTLLMCFTTCYAIYRVVLVLVSKLRKYENHWDRLRGRKTKQLAYPVTQEMSALEQLPSAENIQEMLAQDGEIPDEAYRRNHD